MCTQSVNQLAAQPTNQPPARSVVEEFILHCGAAIGYWQGNITQIMGDIEACKPTLFAGVPRVFERIYNGIQDQVCAGRLYIAVSDTGLCCGHCVVCAPLCCGHCVVGTVLCVHVCVCASPLSLRVCRACLSALTTASRARCACVCLLAH